jgi:hypothetical protein
LEEHLKEFLAAMEKARKARDSDRIEDNDIVIEQMDVMLYHAAHVIVGAVTALERIAAAQERR